jgi:hypothetical protein
VEFETGLSNNGLAISECVHEWTILNDGGHHQTILGGKTHKPGGHGGAIYRTSMERCGILPVNP